MRLSFDTLNNFPYWRRTLQKHSGPIEECNLHDMYELKTTFIWHGNDNEEDDDIDAAAIPAAFGYTNDDDDDDDFFYDDDDDDDKEEKEEAVDGKMKTVHVNEWIFLST